MKIVYPPTEPTLQKIERIRELREAKLTPREIVPIVHLSYSYVCALIEWDKKQLKEDHGA